jgi:hypothetical protein
MLINQTIDWPKLSRQAVHDQDPAKLAIMIDEINGLLEDETADLGQPWKINSGGKIAIRPQPNRP